MKSVFALLFIAPLALAQPDLVAWLSFSNDEPHVGEVFSVNVTTANVGDEPAPESVTRYSNDFEWFDLQVPWLEAGSASIGVFNFTCFQPGVVFFSAEADYYWQVEEAQEENNYASEESYCEPNVYYGDGVYRMFLGDRAFSDAGYEVDLVDYWLPSGGEPADVPAWARYDVWGPDGSFLENALLYEGQVRRFYSQSSSHALRLEFESPGEQNGLPYFLTSLRSLPVPVAVE